MTRWRVLSAFLAILASAKPQTLIDTIGYTDRDLQVYGPATRYMVNDLHRGLHAVWKDGLGAIRYNFRPRGSDWQWTDGIRVNPYARNLGCMDVDTTRGIAIVSSDFVSQGAARLSYFADSLPGSGVFAERVIGSGYRHLLVATSRFGYAKFLASRNDSLFFHSSFYGSYLGDVGPFPAYGLSASKRTGRFCFLWSGFRGSDRGTLYLKESPNNGANWFQTVSLSDSIPAANDRCMLAGAAVYDSIRLHVVACFYDGQDPNRSSLWHYSKYDSPPWHRIHEHNLPDSTRIGDNALAACRPSIGHDPATDDYFVVWEQFDELNVDPSTGLSRADIWASRSTDLGRSWGPPVRLTGPDQTSKRFPYLSEAVDDTLHIICFADHAAGFWERSQGPQTLNEVLHVRMPAASLPVGIDQQPEPEPPGHRSFVWPTVSRVAFALRTCEPSDVSVFDNTGRRICGFSAIGTSVFGSELTPGVYFVRSTAKADATRSFRLRVVKLPSAPGHQR
ncbi:MAG: exo-alpha-sialidase [candidate division WOR-3 bacterium]|nr:MAG: exo-alpha-sialidase [candidate division WOR-3 bacterium]